MNLDINLFKYDKDENILFLDLIDHPAQQLFDDEFISHVAHGKPIRVLGLTKNVEFKLVKSHLLDPSKPMDFKYMVYYQPKRPNEVSVQLKFHIDWNEPK